MTLLVLVASTCVASVMVLIPASSAATGCSTVNGPSGAVTCIRAASYYNMPQWATCLTDSYIRSKSKGRHGCSDNAVSYCYYQCMLEIYDKESGEVLSRCSCDPNDPNPHGSSGVQLPDTCFSPNGTDCDWYRDCLQARFRCSTGKDDYGIVYGEAFCRLYEQMHGDFSPLAQQWINAVRKCLQVELVPLLRPFVSPTCRDVRTQAVRSHSACYENPFKDAPSICQLSLLDFWRVFWTVRTVFAADFVESLFGLMEVLRRCATSPARGMSPYMTKMVINVTLPSRLRYVPWRSKRSADSDLDMPPLFNLSADSDHDIPPLFKRSADSDHDAPLIKRSDDSDHDIPPLSKRSDDSDHDAPFPLRDSFPFETTRSARSAGQTADVSDLPFNAAGESSVAADLRVKRSYPPRSRWGGESPQGRHYHKVAGAVLASLAGEMGWAAEGIVWFAHGDYDGRLKVHVLLADETLTAPSVNLTGLVRQAAEAYEQGNVTLTVDGEDLAGGEMYGCEDQDCRKIYIHVNSEAAAAAHDIWVSATMMASSVSAVLLVTFGFSG